jgi:hypothetical protein
MRKYLLENHKEVCFPAAIVKSSIKDISVTLQGKDARELSKYFGN